MKTLSVVVDLQEYDIRMFVRVMRRRARRWTQLWYYLAAILLFGGTKKLFDLSVASRGTGGWLESPAVPGTIFLLGLYVYWKVVFHIETKIQWEDLTPGDTLPIRYVVEERGLSCSNEWGRRFNPWSEVVMFINTEDHFFVMLGEKTGHIVPKRSFPSPEAAADFSLCVRRHMKKAELAAPADPPA